MRRTLASPAFGKSKFKSDAFEAIHSAAHGLYRAGAMDKMTLRSFDEACLTVPADIPPKKIRESAHVSHFDAKPAHPSPVREEDSQITLFIKRIK